VELFILYWVGLLEGQQKEKNMADNNIQNQGVNQTRQSGSLGPEKKKDQDKKTEGKTQSGNETTGANYSGSQTDNNGSAA
jgi:hypothetical protein